MSSTLAARYRAPRDKFVERRPVDLRSERPTSSLDGEVSMELDPRLTSTNARLLRRTRVPMPERPTRFEREAFGSEGHGEVGQEAGLAEDHGGAVMWPWVENRNGAPPRPRNVPACRIPDLKAQLMERCLIRPAAQSKLNRPVERDRIASAVGDHLTRNRGDRATGVDERLERPGGSDGSHFNHGAEDRRGSRPRDSPKSV